MTQFLIIALTTAWFSFAFAVKGGFLNPYFKEDRDDSTVLFHALGSKMLSAVSVLAYVVFMATFFQTHIGVAIQFKYALLLIVAAWVGIITTRPWPEYSFILNDPDSYYFGHRGGMKECLTKLMYRGIVCGALLTLATGYIPFICFGFLFMPLAFLCLKYGNRKIDDMTGWTLSEWVLGAVCYGIPFGLYMDGLL